MSSINKEAKFNDKLKTDVEVGCFDKPYFIPFSSEALFVSGSPDDYVSFLISVMPERWTFFVPEGFHILEKLGNVG